MRRASLVLIGFCALLGGCFTDPEIAEIVDAVAWELEPASLETEIELRLGDGSLGILRWICSWADDCEEFEELFAGVDEVHLGVYNIRQHRYAGDITLTDGLRAELADEGWQFVVSVREHRGDSTFVLARYDDRGVYGMLVIAQDRDELAVVRLDGELDKAVHRAARRDPDFLVAMHDH